MGENRRAGIYRYGKFIRMDHGFVTKPDYIRVTQTTLASSRAPRLVMQASTTKGGSNAYAC